MALIVAKTTQLQPKPGYLSSHNSQWMMETIPCPQYGKLSQQPWEIQTQTTAGKMAHYELGTTANQKNVEKTKNGKQSLFVRMHSNGEDVNLQSAGAQPLVERNKMPA